MIAFAIIVATGFAQMCLFWAPVNCLLTGLDFCFVEKWIGGLHWIWGIFMFTAVYELLNQLMALPYGVGGLWPVRWTPSLKDWYHSQTLGQFRFVKVVAAVEMLAMLFGCAIILHVEIDGHVGDLQIAKMMCSTTCLCWWINPVRQETGSWYDFGAGFGVNAIVNAFIGDAVINSWLVPLIGRYVKRRFTAKKEPTQHLMDEALRSHDPQYLPWRIVHLVKAWFFAVCLWPLVPLVAAPTAAYFLLSILIDRQNLMRNLEPPPPSNGLCMRFVLSALMPAAVPVHFVVAIFGYIGLLRYPRGQPERSIGDALTDPRLLTYLAFGALIVAGMLRDMFVTQRRLAKQRGLLTPWQVIRASIQTDHGFAISGGGTYSPDLDAHLDMIPKSTLRDLYRPPFLRSDRLFTKKDAKRDADSDQNHERQKRSSEVDDGEVHVDVLLEAAPQDASVPVGQPSPFQIETTQSGTKIHTATGD